MPAFDICLPRRDCSNSGVGGEQDPCEVFANFEFPIDEFFPPQQDVSDNLFINSGDSNGCGCNNSNSCGSNNSNSCGSRCCN